MNQLHNIGSGHSSFLKRPFNLGGSIKNLDDIEEMLRLEKSEFEVRSVYSCTCFLFSFGSNLLCVSKSFLFFFLAF